MRDRKGDEGGRHARVLRIVAVTLVVLFGVVAGLFIAGETFADPGGWKAVLATAAWAVPLVVLSVVALVRPGLSSTLLVGPRRLGHAY